MQQPAVDAEDADEVGGRLQDGDKVRPRPLHAPPAAALGRLGQLALERRDEARQAGARHKVAGARLDGRHDNVERHPVGHDDQRHVDGTLLQDGDGVERAEAPRRDVGDDGVPGPPLQRLDQLRAVVDALGVDVDATLAQRVQDRLGVAVGGLNDEEPERFAQRMPRRTALVRAPAAPADRLSASTVIHPCRRAWITAWVRSLTESFRRMLVK